MAFGVSMRTLQHASVTGDRMNLFDLGQFGELHDAVAFAPARGVHMDEGKEILAGHSGIKVRRYAGDSAAGLVAFDTFVHGRGRQSNLVAQLGVALLGILCEQA